MKSWPSDVSTQWCFLEKTLTLNLLMTTIVAPPSNASKWQMGFNSAFKGLTMGAVQQFYWYWLSFTKMYGGQSQWPDGLRCGSAAARLTGLRVRISSGVWMPVSWECCVSCQIQVFATHKSLIHWNSTACVISECDLETSRMRRLDLLRLSSHEEKVEGFLTRRKGKLGTTL